ncbi:MAG: hypothetical protein II917_03105, partial [Synergistaceae bacterium]|nr:hypothetical protein [Synergistaceae bacterium]
LMAKIKFNLNFGGEQIRTLDDLRDNFSIEDVLDVYNNGLLVKWLDVHNHKAELAKVNAIQATDARSILTELIKIFGISDDPSEIEESLSVLDYLEKRKKVHEDMKAHGIPDYEKVKKERDELARQVEELKEAQYAATPETEIREEAPKPAKKSYDDLVQEIIDNHKDLPHIYDCLDVITADYSDVLAERYSELFNRLYNHVPHVCYALLGHRGVRPFYALTQDEINSVYKNNLTFQKNYGSDSGRYEWYIGGSLFLKDSVIRENRKKVPSIVNEKIRIINVFWYLTRDMFTRKVVDDIHRVVRKEYLFLKTFVCRFPEGLRAERRDWLTVEPDDKKFMLFYGDEFNLFVAGTYTHNKTIEADSLSLTFPIFSGIDALAICKPYQTSDDEKGFCYMETR